MKIALDPAMLGSRPVADAFAVAADVGYEYVELGNRDDVIAAFGPLGASTAELTQARRAAAAAGVEIASVAVIQRWSAPDEEERRHAVELWKDGVTAAVELGCRRINTEFSGDPHRPEECGAAFRRSFEELIPILETEDVEVVVEPHPWDFLETTRAAVDLIHEIDHPRLRYLHCLPHTFYLGGSLTEQVEYAAGWFDHVHVADAFRPQRTIINPPGLDCRVHQHLDLGRGELDLDEARAALDAIGFDGILTVQVFGWEDIAERSFRDGLAAVTRLFGHNGNGSRP